MGRNLVLLFDGTLNEFGRRNSNVVELASVLLKDETQLIYYHAGLGTSGTVDRLHLQEKVRKVTLGLLQSMFGYGIMYNTAKGYEFLIQNYQQGDKIYLFGFSRGAYTARILASILKHFGLIERGNLSLISYVTKLLRSSGENYDLFLPFKKTFGRDIKVHFIGVWDTVSSVGNFITPFSLPSTSKNSIVQNARHAISLDETRASFRANLMTQENPTQDIKQVWFAGDHSDIGGGHKDGEAGLSNISLNWMIEESKTFGLKFKDRFVFLENHLATAHDLTGQALWRLVRHLPKQVWNYETKKYNWKRPGNTRRFIPHGSLIHASVIRKMNTDQNYKPVIPADHEIEGTV